jgi:outer membrane cobalamin receptor
MKREGAWCTIAMLLLFGPGSLGAQETAQSTPPSTQTPAPAETPPAAAPTEVRRTEPVVVTATRSEQPLEQTGASVTVVSEEEMRVQEYRAVEQVLRNVPGVQVGTSGSPGKLSQIRIRGANPTQVRVLVDGVRVKASRPATSTSRTLARRHPADRDPRGPVHALAPTRSAASST